MNKLIINGANAPALTVSSAVLVLLLLMTVSGGVPAAQDKTAPEGLSGGDAEDATAELLEGKWTDVHVHLGKPGSWKHSGGFTISKSQDGRSLEVKFTENGGGDNPNAKNAVKFGGNAVILDRDLSPFKDPNDGSNAQSWRGRLLRDHKDGHLKIEGRINGAGMPWEVKNGNAPTFLAVKVTN